MRLKEGSVPRDLSDHLTDKYAPRMQTLLSKPIVKFKRGEGEEEEVEVVRDQGKRGWSSTIATSQSEKRKRISTGGSVIGEIDVDESFMTNDEFGTSSKPKRKRHVAKFNSDGSLKLCQACGTNSTPMWRRGPAGKSTLCNACGAKWKVGRLIVSGDLPDSPATMEVANTSKLVEEEEFPPAAAPAAVTTPPTPKQVESATNTTEETS